MIEFKGDVNITIDYAEAVALLEKVVEEQGPDHVYPDWVNGCQYFDYSMPDPSPMCIIGHVLNKIDPDHKYRVDVRKNISADTFTYDHPTVRDLFRAAQCHQDAGISWGSAVELAKEEVPE